MSLLKLTWQCFFTPRLYKIYADGPKEANRARLERKLSTWRLTKGKFYSKKLSSRHFHVIVKNLYQPHRLEKWGDNIVSSVLTVWNLSMYTSPLICMYMYKKGYLDTENAAGVVKVVGSIVCVVLMSVLVRGVGRALNPKYLKFVAALQGPQNERKIDQLRKFDFDFSAFPVTYTSDHRVAGNTIANNKSSFSLLRLSPIKFIGYVAVHVFGLRLIYPGTIGLIHALVWNELLRGRTELVEVYNGKRHNLKTPEKNNIDCMFVDQRGATSKGSTLVICCEGNSGFYEIGIMTTPLAGGYSTLGWNHPGFGGSTGLPYPEQEQNAVDTVMQFAINELGFSPRNIVMYGWSIGGYSAAWAAANYPAIRGLVLDATFDDLLPLAIARMPQSWRSLVTEVVREHVNLNVVELLLEYPGEVLLVRRTQDEIICLQEGDLGSNRANDLLLRLMSHRHPEVMGEEQEASLKQLLSLQGLARADMQDRLAKDTDETKQAVLLMSKYMKDYRSTHCTPLPLDYFVVPGAHH